MMMSGSHKTRSAFSLPNTMVSARGIINYDIKYRMGKELDSGEDEE